MMDERQEQLEREVFDHLCWWVRMRFGEDSVTDHTDEEYALGFKANGLDWEITVLSGQVHERTDGIGLRLRATYYPEGLKPEDQVDPRVVLDLTEYNFTRKLWTVDREEIYDRIKYVKGVILTQIQATPHAFPPLYVRRDKHGNDVLLCDAFREGEDLTRPLPGRCLHCGESYTPRQVIDQLLWGSKVVPGLCPACCERPEIDRVVPCESCDKPVPVHSGGPVGAPVWCLRCYNDALGGEVC